MKKITWRERLHYEFDNIMSRGPLVSIAWLALATLAFIVVLTVLVHALGIQPHNDNGTPFNWHEILWFSILQTINANLNVGDVNDSGFMLAVIGASLVGLLIVGSLIGILTNGISSRLEELRKGRSFVVEKGHTIILGWAPTIFTILRELGNARAHENKCIVVLADRDKVAMEDEIHRQVGKLPKTRVVCRTGNPLFIHDLEITNPDHARAIIIPAPEADDPDAHVVKTILALVNRAGRRAEAYHIVAELQDADNLEVARLVAGAEAEFVLTGDLLARLTVQTCRQSGLSVVYEELLAFHGNEIYTLALPPLTGKTYGEALVLMDSCVLIGVETSDGRALLNPRAEFVFQERDRAIVIAPDIAEIRIAETTPVIDSSALVTDKALAPTPERTLLLGWNRRTVDVITGLDAYVIPGSQLTVVCDQENVEAQMQAVGETLSHQTLHFVKGSPTNRRTLERLRVENYDHVVIVNPFDAYPPHEADAHAMITLLHLRALDGKDGRAFSITSEILDPHNRELSEVAQPDDFIVSTQLVSLMLAQLAENPQNANIFTDLFAPEGMEIYLRPMDLYVLPQRQVNFFTLLEAALRRGETAIGYRLQRHAHDPSKNYGVVLNPNKSEPIAFDANDRLIVVAES
jgi:voltage-gated potassium channel Kch